jgi:hypothetical protein
MILHNFMPTEKIIMKRKLLTLLVPLLGTFIGYSQPELTVTAPTATSSTGLRAPNGTTVHTTVRGLIIVTAAELSAIPSGTIITKLNMLLAAGATPGPAGGTIQFYLENTADVTNLKSTTWATAISTMTSVYSGAYAVPAVAGPTTVLTLSTGFVYTGGSIYVGYDYLGSTFTSTSGTYSANTSVGGGWIGDVNATTTPAATLTQFSSFRPCFQFTFANPFSNELNVSGVAGEKGIFNNTIKTTQTVTSLISNTSVAAIANVPVTLTVAGANPYTITQTIPTIASGGTATLLFNNVPSVNLGTQTVTISIPADDVPGNNTQVFNQQVQCDTIGYTQTPVQSGGVGFNTGAGLIAVRHVIPATIETYVTSVSNYFPTDASNAGNTMKGILLDANGFILDSTNVINTTAGMLGTKQNFDFINGAIDVSGVVIYVGFRQDANTVTGYFPFANQANSYVDPNAAATFGVFGGAPAPLGSGLGYMMIDAALAYGGFNVANSSTAGTLCSNSTLTISPTVGYTNYEFFVDGSSVQNGATPTHTTGPISTTTTYNVEITNGACVINSNLQTITIVPALINNITDGFCPGQTFTFGSQTLTAAGTYADTLLSTAGCDSIVNLTLNVLVPTSSSISASICQGQSYTFGSQTLTSAGSYTDVVPNAAGCDSTITLALAVNAPSASSSTVTACANTYQFGGQSLTASGTYTNTVLNAAGCDSVITLNLTLNAPAVVTATLTGVTLTATGTPGSITYQWIDCGTNLPVSGATSATFNPTLNGSYAVIAQTTDGCEDTSACLTVSTIGLDELLATSVLVYPNPATNEINAVTNGMQILSYAVLDANGRVVLSKTLNENTTEIGISLESISEGTYILELKTSESSVYKRFVKN